MTLPTTPELRAQVEEALASEGVEVGTYTYLGGGTSPAICVGDPPEGTSVTGLEVLIARNPDRSTLPGFEFIGFIEEWPIRFINWGNADLEAAANALAVAFHPLAQDPQILPASPDYPEQLTLKITADPSTGA
ncbi:hypothetical protein [Deinococcus sp. UYEF24]